MLTNSTIVVLAAILIVNAGAFLIAATFQSQQREQQVKSEGRLTPLLNGDSLRKGDSIILSANPKMTQSYLVPSTGFKREEVRFVFAYDADSLRATGMSVASAGITAKVSPSSSTIFQSHVDGFRVEVPSGWVIEDIDNTALVARQAERSLGGGLLARLCPKDVATPQIDGKYSCAHGPDYVLIFRYADLKSRPEFADMARQNRNITTSDFAVFYLLFLERLFGFTNFRLLEDIDTAVNVTDPETNQTIATAPAKYIEVTYLDAPGQHQDRDIALLVMANDDNTGYALIPSISIMRPEHLPPEHQQVLDSFELLVPNNSSSSNQLSPSPVPFPAPQLVEREQSPASQFENGYNCSNSRRNNHSCSEV